LPGAILWFGLLKTGAHPTLAGVVLGLMTPVLAKPSSTPPISQAELALQNTQTQLTQSAPDAQQIHQQLRAMQTAQRDVLPPALRLPMVLHPWVAFGVMPVFALANAGVQLSGTDLQSAAPQAAVWAVLAALVLGKPLGIVLATLLAVKTRICSLPAGLNRHGVLLVGLLAGIGFTMSIFVGGLAFEDTSLLGAAKLGVLSASAIAAVLGLLFGALFRQRIVTPGQPS
jgi:NhaA family Na+:H+ antiporter